MLNVTSAIFEFLTGCIYIPKEKALAAESCEYDITERIKLCFLPCNLNETFVKNERKYADFFDIIYLGNSFGHRVQDSVSLCKSNGKIFVEGVNYLYDLRQEHVLAYNEKILEQAKQKGLKKLFDQDLPDFLIFNKV
jgi:hypothetical protein